MTNKDEIRKQMANYAHYRILISSFADPLEGNDIIYHYTTIEGLKGILESNEIWLTNTAFVNDTTECKSLHNEENLFKESDITNPFVKKQWEYLINRPDKENNLYVLSFSEKGNALDQFRAYGNFCIGFDVKKMTKEGFYLYKCIYEPSDIKKWILGKSNSGRWVNSLDDEYKRAAAFLLIHASSVKYKNVHYQNEKEIRMVCVSYPKWDYPDSPEMYENCPPIHYRNHHAFEFPVPYVKFFLEEHPNNYADKYKEYIKNIGKTSCNTKINYEVLLTQWKIEWEKNVKRKLLPIKEIRIGPMPHQQEAKTACEILLYEKGYKDFKVILSDIPYRGFR